MAKRNDDKSRIERIVIAVTEMSPVQHLWHEALQLLEESRAELHALFVEDEKWHRAATLPFTREISRFSGIDADFTLQRAMEVHRQAIERAQRQFRQLAEEAERELTFEVLQESDRERARHLAEDGECLVIAPADLADEPLVRDLRERGCRIVLIDGK